MPVSGSVFSACFQGIREGISFEVNACKNPGDSDLIKGFNNFTDQLKMNGFKIVSMNIKNGSSGIRRVAIFALVSFFAGWSNAYADDFDCSKSELKKMVAQALKLSGALTGNVKSDANLIYEIMPKGESIEKVHQLLSSVRDAQPNRFKFEDDKKRLMLYLTAYIDNEKYYVDYSIGFIFEHNKLKYVAFSGLNFFKDNPKKTETPEGE